MDTKSSPIESRPSGYFKLNRLQHLWFLKINEDDVLMVSEVQAKKEKVSMYRFFQDMKVVGETEIKE